MYKQFYGFERNPFDISPDPYFLFQTPQHNEALASIYHGVTQHKGFVVVTGEVGTGKTLLLRCLLESLRKSEIAFANIFNPGLTPLEFLEYLVSDLGLKAVNQNKSSLLLQLNGYLIGRYRAGLTTVLVVDEAQHLAPEVLEEIRLLTNLETTHQKLLQIVLAGQPELEQKLDSANLRQLKQRIAFRCRLEPLEEEQTKGYILQRLERAGASSQKGDIFPDATVQAVHRFAKGTPRLINTICENSLIAAYSQRLQSVTPKIVEEIATDFHLDDLHLNDLQNEAKSAPSREVEASSVARSLLQLMETLDQIARTRQCSLRRVPE